jgi:CRISPR/Cas system CSM-associated protein Csm3 (group 7 of RAMP superfamily)
MSPFQRQQPMPSNYKALPSAGTRPGPNLDARSHEKLRSDTLSGQVDLVFTTVDPVHIGAGSHVVVDLGAGPRGTTLARSMIVVTAADGSFVPVIPGSSIKGAVRSLCEAIAGGCDLTAPCRPKCVTCCIFGHADQTSAFASRVGFDDAYPRSSAEAQDRMAFTNLRMPYQPRKRAGRRIYSPPVDVGRADVPYEIIDKGLDLLSRMQFLNMSEAELGLVFLALGLDQSFCLRVGGGKFGGLGRVRVTAPRVSLRKGYRSPAPSVLEGSSATGIVTRTAGAAEKGMDQRARGVLTTLRNTLAPR